MLASAGCNIMYIQSVAEGSVSGALPDTSVLKVSDLTS